MRLAALVLLLCAEFSRSSGLVAAAEASSAASGEFQEYLSKRNAFLGAEEQLSINSVFHLSEEEERVDALLQQLKAVDRELDPVPTQFAFSTMKETIDESKLFHLIRHVPKGALLHSHDTSSVGMEFYVRESYRPGCLYNIGDDADMYGTVSFKPGPDFVPISEVRKSWPDGPDAFDEELYQNFTLLPYLGQADTTGDYLWSKFQPIFSRIGDMYEYLPVFKQYFRESFPKLWADGITHWEMRTSLNGVYDENRTYSKAETLQFILDELVAWQSTNPEYSVFSFSIVIQGIRSATVEEVTSALISAYELRAAFPGIIVGFDLVGHEDPGKTLLYWAPILIATEEALLQNETYGAKMPFLFHAGESNRAAVQENLVDAVLLNTTRIGHGFGIQGFPALWPLLTAKSIIIESCPISNQLLGLIVDQRNHPVGEMLHHAAHNFTHTESAKYQELIQANSALKDLFDKLAFIPSLAVSISNDDPGFWGIDAIVSYDWYIAVLAWDLSLGAIKQLAMDSIVYSGLSTETRAQQLLHWNKQWEEFISKFQ